MFNLSFGQGDEPNELSEPPKIVSKPRHTRVSKPIPIGMHHTVCGSEAINLAKRLTEELASQQVAQCGSLGNTTTQTVSTEHSPEELRSRSLEQGEKSKGNILCAKASLHSLFFFLFLFLSVLTLALARFREFNLKTKMNNEKSRNSNQTQQKLFAKLTIEISSTPKTET